MTTVGNRIYRFENFVIDVARREIRRDSEELVVQPRVFDLLVYLAENHERAVGKDELQDAVWPGMIITETALTRAVMKARKAVGDDASRQAVIKTIHGHGYRFVAERLAANADDKAAGAEILEPLPAAAKPVPVVLAERESRSRRPLKLLLGAAAVVLLSVLAWILLRPPVTLDGETRIAVLPLADETGNPDLAWTRLGLMSYASNLIKADGGLAVVPEGSVVSLAENTGWSGDVEGPENSDLLSKLRQVYGATHMLAMRLESEGRALRMNFSLLGPDGSARQGTMVGDEGTELTQGVVQSVYSSLLRKRHRRGEVPLVSEDPFNNEAYARGMDLVLQGRCAEAVQFFNIIIEQEPGLFAPRFEYAACRRILGDWEEAEALLDELIAEQRLLGRTRPLAQALMTQGILYNRTGRLDLAWRAHEEALEVSESLQDREFSAKILQNQAIVLDDRGQWQEAEELLDLAVLAYQDAGRETMPGQLYSGKANLRMAKGELVEAEEYLEKALQAFREIGDRRNEAMMLNNTGYLLRNLGRLEEAEEYHLRSLEIRQEIDDRVGVGRVHGMLSAVYTAQGRYREAIAASSSALEIALETRDRLFEGTSLAQLGDAEKAVGDYQSARQHYQQGRVVFSDIQDGMRVLQSDLKLARLDIIQKATARAESTALRVLEEARQNELMQPEIQAMELLGDIAMERGEVENAIAEYEAAITRVRESTWASKENTLAQKLVNAYLDIGDLDSAAPLVGALGGQEPNLQSLKVQARFAWIRGDATTAVKLMEQARELAGENWTDESEAAMQQYRAKDL